MDKWNTSLLRGSWQLQERIGKNKLEEKQPYVLSSSTAVVTTG